MTELRERECWIKGGRREGVWEGEGVSECGTKLK